MNALRARRGMWSGVIAGACGMSVFPALLLGEYWGAGAAAALAVANLAYALRETRP